MSSGSLLAPPPSHAPTEEAAGAAASSLAGRASGASLCPSTTPGCMRGRRGPAGSGVLQSQGRQPAGRERGSLVGSSKGEAGRGGTRRHRACFLQT